MITTHPHALVSFDVTRNMFATKSGLMQAPQNCAFFFVTHIYTHAKHLHYCICPPYSISLHNFVVNVGIVSLIIMLILWMKRVCDSLLTCMRSIDNLHEIGIL